MGPKDDFDLLAHIARAIASSSEMHGDCSRPCLPLMWCRVSTRCATGYATDRGFGIIPPLCDLILCQLVSIYTHALPDLSELQTHQRHPWVIEL